MSFGIERNHNNPRLKAAIIELREVTKKHGVENFYFFVAEDEGDGWATTDTMHMEPDVMPCLADTLLDQEEFKDACILVTSMRIQREREDGNAA